MQGELFTISRGGVFKGREQEIASLIKSEDAVQLVIAASGSGKSVLLGKMCQRYSEAQLCNHSWRPKACLTEVHRLRAATDLNILITSFVGAVGEVTLFAPKLADAHGFDHPGSVNRCVMHLPHTVCTLGGHDP